MVTFVPATAAMFGVVREWRRGDEPNIFPSFVRHFRANFRQAFGIGLLWLLTARGARPRLPPGRQLPAGAQFPAFLVLAHGRHRLRRHLGVLFPVMVGYEADWRALIRNSFLIFAQSTAHLRRRPRGGGRWGISRLRLPLTLLVVAERRVAYLIHAICSRGSGAGASG